MTGHIVQRGETLSSIARTKLGRADRWPEITAMNQILNPNLIFVGQKLKLPAANVPIKNAAVVATAGVQHVPASVALARGFLFVIFEQLPEVGVGKIIRKVAAIPRNFALLPANPQGTISAAEHVLNLRPKVSPFLSASERAFGAPTINGQPVLLDIAKIKAAGGQVYSVSAVVADLERFAAQNPSSRQAVQKLIETVRNIEGEVLIKGHAPESAISKPSAAHTNYIQSAEHLWDAYKAKKITLMELQQELLALEKGYEKARIVGKVGRVLTVVGVIFTVIDVGKATQKSFEQKSLKPLGAEGIRQVGGWGGAKIGALAGAAFGIETGPGAIVTGAIGAIVFGAACYFGADWLADKISPN